jgi:hypothetical protein
VFGGCVGGVGVGDLFEHGHGVVGERRCLGLVGMGGGCGLAASSEAVQERETGVGDGWR